MGINFKLKNAFEIDQKTDSMNRTWVGWDPLCSDEDLWRVNRGRWALGPDVLDQRFATLSFDGQIRVVAEIDGLEDVDDPRRQRPKKALIGQVLLPGDPARDCLIGRRAPSGRNPVGYFDTSESDALSSAQRAVRPPESRATYLVTYNPDLWQLKPTDYERECASTDSGRIVRGSWSTGLRRKTIVPGDRVFLLQQGSGERGLLGSGTFNSRVFQDNHWLDESKTANYAFIDWGTLLRPEHLLPIEVLKAQLPHQEWEPQSSGIVVASPQAEELENLWSEHLGRPIHSRTTPRQRWQLDPLRRKQVEDLAQARLEKHYRDKNWIVEDVRYGHPYDAVAVKDAAVLFLEAKGTESTGSSVLVTRGEVDHARQHPGQCILGILSDIQFLSNGEVDPRSGNFRIMPFTPDSGELIPTGYSWTPPNQ
ncbi:protein NO VEIN domain-containing protein [Kribbella qitaiheensis]|nr:DUF3883 domain-containing protein [Kribbella qitaiheensis]